MGITPPGYGKNAGLKKALERIHLVDLDGSVAGLPKNAPVICEIAKSVSVPVEVGGVFAVWRRLIIIIRQRRVECDSRHGSDPG